MAGSSPFGFDPDDIDRVLREVGEGLRGALSQLGGSERAGWSVLFDEVSRRGRPDAPPEPATTGEQGDGVWVVYTVGDAGAAQVEQVFATELDALRANQANTDAARRVRFLPYGMPVTVLDPK